MKSFLMLVCVAWLALTGTAGAGLSEPPNVLFGFVTVSNVVITPDRTDMVIEARRSPGGPVVASYRVGTTLEFGDAYVLEIPLDSGTPSATGSPSTASVAGATLQVSLRQEDSVLATVAYTVGPRGKFQRLDFVVGQSSDTNGLPDAWEIANFGVAGQNPNGDPDRDGVTNIQEYMAGTNPNSADGFRLDIRQFGQDVQVSFFAKQAQGAGYEGRTRVYSLETSTNVAENAWKPVTGFNSVFGNNQTLVFVVPAGNAPPAFFRAQVTTR